MHFNTFRQETLATTLTATSQGSATVLRFHTSAKTELAFAGALGSLVGAFRHGRRVFRKRSRRIAVKTGLSTYGWAICCPGKTPAGDRGECGDLAHGDPAVSGSAGSRAIGGGGAGWRGGDTIRRSGRYFWRNGSVWRRNGSKFWRIGGTIGRRGTTGRRSASNFPRTGS